MFQMLLDEATRFLFRRCSTNFALLSSFFLSLEALVTAFIVRNVKYTEIDWSTYMQQTHLFEAGERNYSRIEGDTGPVVYPAGHIYFYQLLSLVTRRGENIYIGQCIFSILYLTNLAVVSSIYRTSKVMPPFIVLLLGVTGYRIHSIFVLRMFNDPIAMLLFYIALSMFIRKYWIAGSVFFSLAVSMKMNVLLLAPAMFFTLLFSTGILKTLLCIALCGFIQLAVALPFVLHDPIAYAKRSFDLGRVFMFKWTVNWRFLPEEIFLDKRFHIALLIAHLAVLSLFGLFLWFRKQNGLASMLKNWVSGTRIVSLQEDEIIYAFFTSNLIGIAFARSLHYQFYSWYYHQLPFILFYNFPASGNKFSDIPFVAVSWRILTLLGIEIAFNVYPSTSWSSALLHICHAVILINAVVGRRPIVSAKKQD